MGVYKNIFAVSPCHKVSPALPEASMLLGRVAFVAGTSCVLVRIRLADYTHVFQETKIVILRPSFS